MMRLNCIKSLVSLSSASLIKCNKSYGLRAFASLKNAAVTANDKSVSANTSELLRNLKNEYEDQKEMVKEHAEELDPKSVLENFSDFLKENNWTLEHSENSTLVTLKRRDESLQADLSIKFDVVEIFNENEVDSSEEMMLEEENEIESSEEVDEEVQFVTLPFSLEIKRDSIPGKTLLFDCVLEGDEAENNIVIENVAVMPADNTTNNKLQSSYTSPNYSQLDETLQEDFEKFVNNLVGSEELMAFVKNYSIASESELYQNWLQDVRSILKN